MPIPSSIKQLEYGVTLPVPVANLSTRSVLPNFDFGSQGSLVHRSWEAPEPVGFPYLWHLNQYYLARDIDIYTFRGYGDNYVVCISDGGCGSNQCYAVMRLWVAGATLSNPYRLLVYFMRLCGMLLIFGDTSQMNAAMTIDEANRDGMRYIQILNLYSNPGVGAAILNWKQFRRDHRGQAPPGFEDLLVCRSTVV